MFYKRELWVSEQAKHLGHQLLRELNIHAGYGIADYLSVNPGYENRAALLIWLDAQLAKPPDGGEIEQIKQDFFEHFPESYGLC